MRLPATETQAHRHLRRRAQRADADAAALRAENDRLRARIEEDRRALQAYLDGPEGEYDRLLDAQRCIAEALRDLATRHQSCRSCGGYRRVMLDDLLEPELRARREALGLPGPAPLEQRAGAWPVGEGALYYRKQALSPYVNADEREERERRSRAFQAEMNRPGIGDW